jgi:hypothetical protein
LVELVVPLFKSNRRETDPPMTNVMKNKARIMSAVVIIITPPIVDVGLEIAPRL